MADEQPPNSRQVRPKGRVRTWYLRVIAALAPLVVMVETFEISRAYRQDGLRSVNVVDVLLLLAWGAIFVMYTVPYASALLNKKEKNQD